MQHIDLLPAETAAKQDRWYDRIRQLVGKQLSGQDRGELRGQLLEVVRPER